MTPSTAAAWVRALDLRPHPEGGWYRETYRAAEGVEAAHLPPRFGGRRAFSTAIYFLLERGQVSRLHRIKSDELWHLYAGGPLTIAVLHPDGSLAELGLGVDVARGHAPQVVVPAGCWFGAWLGGAAYALVGCTVAPGFDFADFELADRATLLRAFPQHRAVIERLT